MARPPRLQAAGAWYHLMSRGAVRQAIFRNNLDRHVFLALLTEVVRTHSWLCVGYCLLTTHYHLLVRTPEPNLADGMKRLNQLYAQGFNARHGGRGHVFEGRYVSVLIERETHLLELFRYFALNPVRAGLCGAPARWRWSSYPAVLGLIERPPFLAADAVLRLFAAEPAVARKRLHAFVDGRLSGASS
jgi:REP element-mobilizing transposase RayT